MLYRIRDKPELGGAWGSARNVAWPTPKVSGATPASGSKKPPAEGVKSAA